MTAKQHEWTKKIPELEDENIGKGITEDTKKPQVLSRIA